MGFLTPLSRRTGAKTAAPVLLLMLMLMLMLAVIPRAPAQEIHPEYAVKAAFLYHFCQFIEWPSTAFTTKSAPLVIGVLGDNPFGSILGETIRGEVINGRSIRLEHYGRVDEVRNCHILFICASENSRLPAILGRLRGRSTVTVGETGSFISRGGMIALTTEKNRVRLRINLAAVRQASISMSSKLLRVADIARS